MNYLKRAVVRAILLNKRLFKKISFLLILLAVPVMVLAVELISRGQSGIVTVALAAEDPADPIASEVIEKLVNDAGGVERFILCKTPKEAENKVLYGEADGAWILEDDMAGKISAFVVDLKEGHSCVRIVEREETIALELAREKLSGVMSSYISYALMRDFAYENCPELAGMSEEELRFYFDDAYGSDDIFEFSYLDSGEPTDDVSLDLIMLPVRGLLSVTVVLAGLASAMYYMKDEESQVFYRLKRAERPAFAYAYQFTGVFDVAVVALCALFIAGISAAPGREIAAMLIFCFAVSSFCILVRRLCGKLGRLGAVTPLLIVALIAVSPIFFNMAEIRWIQLFTPTYYYLKSIHQSAYLGYGAIYAAALAAIDYAVYKLTDRA